MPEDSFTAFFRRHHRVLLATARRRLGDPHDAEDAVAEAFRIAFIHYRRTNELELPWVQQVLRNVIGSEYRRASRAHRLSARAHPAPTDLVTWPTDEHRTHVRQMLLDLPPRDRQILFLAYWADLPGDELAAACDCTPGTARLRLMRARRRFRALLPDDSSPAGAVARPT